MGKATVLYFLKRCVVFPKENSIQPRRSQMKEGNAKFPTKSLVAKAHFQRQGKSSMI